MPYILKNFEDQESRFIPTLANKLSRLVAGGSPIPHPQLINNSLRPARSNILISPPTENPGQSAPLSVGNSIP